MKKKLKVFLTGLSMTDLCMSTAKAKIPIPREFEQRILETKLIKGQMLIKTRLEESENSLDYVKNEIKALAREASNLSTENSERWQRRCNKVRKLSDSELAELIQFQTELIEQGKAWSAPLVADDLSYKVKSLGGPILQSLDGRATELARQYREIRETNQWFSESGHTIKQQIPSEQEIPEEQAYLPEIKDVLSLCQSPKLFAEVFTSLTPQIGAQMGQGTLLNASPTDADCRRVRVEFKKYEELFEESSHLLEELANRVGDQIGDPESEDRFNLIYDEINNHLQSVLADMSATYADHRFERDKEYRVIWRGVASHSHPSFEFARFGPNKWEKGWSVSLGRQSWVMSEPAFDGQGDLSFSLKASVHDICVDRRQVWLIGSTGEGVCAQDSCSPLFFLQATPP